jgi:hypothetical protein
MAYPVRALLVVALLAGATTPADIQSQTITAVTSPKQQFGFSIGDDHVLATYAQFETYWRLLDRESERMSIVEIGKTEEGRAQLMAIVTAPENMPRLDRFRSISRRLALAEASNDDEARALAREGKTVVWIDGGLHATEVLGAQQLIELTYQLVSGSDAETERFLRDTIVLLVHANPDGHALVADWYMREPDPRRRSFDDVPRAYQKYVGHDNNRDFYLSSQAETINMNRVLYREWFPQIVYDHHQAGPPGTVMFAPPFRDPFNYVFDPLVPVTIDLIGGAMHTRFAAEGKPGVTMRNGSSFSTWWNGGLRTTAYFHNQIGLLTETIGSPTPMRIPFVAERQVPSADLPHPIAPREWRFIESIDYSMTANRAVLDVASRYRETLLFNSHLMARRAIERGSRDTWTASPRDPVTPGGTVRPKRERDARGYILPADQPDFLTATKFVDTLLKNGITVHRATTGFTAGGRSYPAGSYVVKAAQPFRPYVRDMFEPQEHPDDIPYPGGPPRPPYDNAGWTLAFQMGVKFDRVLDGFDGPFEPVSEVVPPAGVVSGVTRPAGYLVSHHQNDAFVAVNRLLRAGEEVYWPSDRTAGGTSAETGAMYIAATPTTLPILQKAAGDLGLSFTGVRTRPAGDALRIRPVRIALWDRYGGSSPSGWTRWMLERYEFPFEVVYVQALDAGRLAERFDVLVLASDAQPTSRAERADPASLPAEYRGTTGAISLERTVPQLQQFVRDGGTLMLIGGSSSLAERLGAPLRSALRVREGDGTRPLRRDEYYVPGSILRVSVDNRTPLGYGFEREVDVFFENNPAFLLEPGSADTSVRSVAWFANGQPLRSGWAWGQRHLDSAVAVADARVGRGRILAFGPEINYRAQPHGTFKFLFNGIFIGKAQPVPEIGARAGSR